MRKRGGGVTKLMLVSLKKRGLFLIIDRVNCRFLTIQSFNALRKDSLINRSLTNSTHYVFFKLNGPGAKSLKNFMNGFSVRLKSGQSVWDVFNKNIQKTNTRYAYLLLCISPRLASHKCMSNFLISNEGNMVSFHDSDSDSE